MKQAPGPASNLRRASAPIYGNRMCERGDCGNLGLIRDRASATAAGGRSQEEHVETQTEETCGHIEEETLHRLN